MDKFIKINLMIIKLKHTVKILTRTIVTIGFLYFLINLPKNICYLTAISHFHNHEYDIAMREFSSLKSFRFSEEYCDSIRQIYGLQVRSQKDDGLNLLNLFLNETDEKKIQDVISDSGISFYLDKNKIHLSVDDNTKYNIAGLTYVSDACLVFNNKLEALEVSVENHIVNPRIMYDLCSTFDSKFMPTDVQITPYSKYHQKYLWNFINGYIELDYYPGYQKHKNENNKWIEEISTLRLYILK